MHDARGVFSRFIDRHSGRIVNTAGDGLIAEFPSVVEAVQCAIEVQRELGDRSRDAGGDLRFRIGIHLGDVMVDGNDLLGEGVNLAARLQTMAEPGGIFISQQVYDQVQSKLSIGFEYLGEKRLKNFLENVPVYRVSPRKSIFGAARGARKLRPSRAPESVTPTLGADLRERIVRHVKALSILWAVLVVIDLATGSPFFAHWPGIAFAAFLAWEAAPLFARGWLKPLFVRGLVIVGALALINLFSWSGYPWVLWPAGALIIIEAIRQLVVRLR